MHILPLRALRAALFVSACSFSMAALAQEAVDLPPVDAESEAAASLSVPPLSTRELTRDDLRRRQTGTSDTADLLRHLPGISVNTGGGFSSMPVIRGLSEQRLTILVDGRPIDAACPNDMNPPLSYTDPQTVQAIRVIPGVAPVSMGGDNIGGVIAVESARPRFATGPGGLATGEVSAFYRSNGDGFGGAAMLTLASESLSATYTGSYATSDQYKGGGNRGTVRSTEYRKTDHALALAWQNGAGLFRLKGGYHFSPFEGFPNQAMDMVSNKSWFVSGGYDGVFDWGTVALTADYRDTDHEMNFLEDKLPGAMPMFTEVHSLDSTLKVELPVSRAGTLRFGGEYHHQWLDDYWPLVPGNMMMGPNTFVNINGATRDRIGAYGEWEHRWSDVFATSAGVRMDHVRMNTGTVQPYGTGMMAMDDAMAAMAFNAADRRQRDTNWSATFLASITPARWIAIELGFAQKVRSPNIYERYSWGRGAMASRMIGWYGDGNGYVGNLALRPEKADTFSLAVEFKGDRDRWSLRLAPYYTHVNDYIDARLLRPIINHMGMPTPWVQLQFANQEAEFLGVDLSGHVALSQGAEGQGTHLTGSLSYLRGENLTDHGALYRQMPLNLKLGLEHRHGAIEAGADVEWVAEKNRVDATRNEPRTRAYALVNLRAAYTLGAVRLGAEVTNLFDKGYDLPLGGVSLGDHKATGVLRPVPGRGRSFNLGLSAKF